MLTLPLFYYPSSIVWVDDDPLFLKTAASVICANNLIHCFNDPHACMNFFEDYHSPLRKMSFLRSHLDCERGDDALHSLVDFNVSQLSRVYNDPDRSKEISVLIVDYDLPHMNGIELCKKLKHLPIKKILLTGEADHREAVTAFNDNTIDRFVRKDSPNLVAEVQLYISSLSQQFFIEHTQPLLSHLEVTLPSPLSDEIFIRFFQEWCHKNSIKEFYLINKTGSLLLINQNNESSYFILHTDQSLNAFVNLHDDIIEAENYLNLVRNREKIPFFGAGKEGWEFEMEDWEGRFFGVERTEGRVRYYWKNINFNNFTK